MMIEYRLLVVMKRKQQIVVGRANTMVLSEDFWIRLSALQLCGLSRDRVAREDYGSRTPRPQGILPLEPRAPEPIRRPAGHW